MNILNYFEKTCNDKKDKIAVIFKEEKITYKELLVNSQKIGSYLSKYVMNNDPIIVFMEKSIDALEAFFGILYSKGCYSLVNPNFPEDRIKQIEETLNNKIVVTDSIYIEKAKKIFDNSLVFDIEKLKEANIDLEMLKSNINTKLDIDPVYINFTSGSTGIPKGVVVSHKSIIDFIEIFTNEFDITEKDIIANQAPFDFDVSVKDIYSTIFKGSTLLIVPKEYFSNPSILLDYLIENNATTLIWAVSALCLITTFHGFDYKVPTKINKVIFSGEVMPLKHLSIWMEKLDKCKFVNVYGPTEITCNCTYHVIDRNRTYKDAIPIGKPFINEKVFLLDGNKLVETKNKVGEICVSGSCLSLGYYNNYEQTSKYFCQNPLNNNYFERIYRTGDLAKYNENGELVFISRKDFQIKYMGHRIELEEIDKKIMDIDSIIRVCTVFDDSKIYSFYIGDIDEKSVRLLLKDKLPVYMIPSKIIKLDNLPITKNGKIDRKKLLEIYKK